MNIQVDDAVLKLRWAVLLVMGIVVFGAYYAFDALSPIASYIISELSMGFYSAITVYPTSSWY